MNPQLAEAIAPLIALFGLGGFTLLGLRMWIGYRTDRLRLGAGESEAVRELAEAVGQLRDEVSLTRQELTELHERVDFAERLLARSRDDEQRRLE